MYLLSIVIDKNVEELKVELYKQIESFINEGIKIDEQINYDEPSYILKYTVDIKSVKNYPIKDFVNIFKYCTANALFQYIKLYEEPQILHKTINHEYYYFNAQERSKIENKAKSYIKNQGDRTRDDNKLNYKKRFEIIQRFVDYLKADTTININGFITFRLQDYILGLQAIVERAVEDFLMDKEYNEFIKLLKYFVEIQDAKIDTLNIVLEENNKYSLYDGYGNVVHDEYLDIIEMEMKNNNINYEDLLISSLITIAPNKIFIHKIHNISNVEIIKTITRVFVDKVTICDNCQWCGIKASIKKE